MQTFLAILGFLFNWVPKLFKKSNTVDIKDYYDNIIKLEAEIDFLKKNLDELNTSITKCKKISDKDIEYLKLSLLGDKCSIKGMNSISVGKFCESDGCQSMSVGYSAKTRLRAQIAHSSGAFATPGDAQAAEYCAFRVTSDNNWNDLFIDGSKVKLDIMKKTTLTFLIKIAAYNNTLDEGFGFYFRGALFRTGSDKLQLGYIKEEYDNKSLRGYDAKLEVDNEKKALSIKVKGLSNSLIRWNAVIQCSEVNFARM